MYHATPPNAGGAPDINDAYDRSEQRWGVTFTKILSIPSCGRAPGAKGDPCARIASLSGASGTARANATVAHRHLDGLFPAQNASIRCRVRAAGLPGRPLTAAIRLRYSPAARTIAVTALNPVADPLILVPGQCPGQGDPIDGLADNYFMPGFSFAQGFGSDRWFKSKTVVIPAGVFHKAARITIPLGDTPAGTPPPKCAVKSPEFERCAVRGSWAGVLTLTARP
jgi:hypothetical protein